MDPVVSLRQFSKTFGGTHALRDVDMDLYPGEIHALVGQNGSGKSTLVKILAGYHAPDSGQLIVRGEPIRMPIPAEQLPQLGFAFVHQDLALAESLSIVDNVRVRTHATRGFWKIPWGTERAQVREHLRQFDLDIDPELSVSSLSVAERTVVAIARAMHVPESGHAPVLLATDEPTSYLPADERKLLFAALRRMTDRGVAVLFVTHRLDEVEEVADRVTVLRDGGVAGSWRTREIEPGRILRAIVGRELGDLYPQGDTEASPETVLRVRSLTRSPIEDVSFDLRRGEIVGITGLLGTGYGAVPYMIYGSARPTGGSVVLDGKAHTHLTPSISLRSGLALLPGDRQHQGSIPTETLAANVTMATLASYWRRGRLGFRRQRQYTLDLLREFQVVPPAPDALMNSLSGGNQQKSILGKWLKHPNLKVLMLHEPTQGVDIGARQMLFAQVRAAADRGIALLYASAEYEDLAHLCDRVLVMRSGRIVRELTGTDVTFERIVEQCYTGGQAPASDATIGSHAV